MNSGDISPVSFNYDKKVTYGGRVPYESHDNPAYDFVWKTVERLGMGTSRNPLSSIIKPGNTVLIKPNLIDSIPGTYTRPEVVRPVIDMAVAAGAGKIHIADAGINFIETEQTLDATHYSEMAWCLQRRHPAITIEALNLNRLPRWRWVFLGDGSSFYNSGYRNDEAAFDYGEPLLNHKYYLTADRLGRSPEGKPLGWYAISDSILDADVVINMPKMKTHWTMLVTLSMKNLVGCTVASTYDHKAGNGANLARIPHCHVRKTNYFDNDISARVLQDLNKIIFYCDKDGRLKKRKQRNYLTVIDGIDAMEKSQTPLYNSKGKRRMSHMVLAGQDPVSTDMVACRAMGYDYRQIPVLKKSEMDNTHKIGNYNSDNIVILGENLDTRINHVFGFNDLWKKDAKCLAIKKFSSPKIRTVTKKGKKVIAIIDNCTAAHLMYGKGDLLTMSGKGNTYVAELPLSEKEVCIFAHDRYLNSINKQCDFA
ncbi:MAG: DUF362 domain-containing protein [Syntrophaceae bacterium]|nr:DUF362 domain-containing protein [Syntrophaceae bacterium]